MKLLDFIDENPGWSLIALIIVCTMLEKIFAQ